jgi:hypothetical protein
MSNSFMHPQGVSRETGDFYTPENPVFGSFYSPEIRTGQNQPPIHFLDHKNIRLHDPDLTASARADTAPGSKKGSSA